MIGRSITSEEEDRRKRDRERNNSEGSNKAVDEDCLRLRKK